MHLKSSLRYSLVVFVCITMVNVSIATPVRIKYDQRQEGEYNVAAHIKKFIALIPSEIFESESALKPDGELDFNDLNYEEVLKFLNLNNLEISRKMQSILNETGSAAGSQISRQNFEHLKELNSYNVEISQYMGTILNSEGVNQLFDDIKEINQHNLEISQKMSKILNGNETADEDLLCDLDVVELKELNQSNIDISQHIVTVLNDGGDSTY
uniref:Uncharacterized protein n=1 Tax=Cacopsylla melanoneura TaxID=428564 RepID=A0A8D8RDH0_9HEMI